jgi:hypothetical protein
MMMKAIRILALVGLCFAAAGTAFAQGNLPPLPTTQQQIEDRLKQFDPEAVAAARHYYESPGIRDGLLGMLKHLTPTLIANQERIKGSSLSSEDRARIISALDKSMGDNFHLLLELSMVAALEVLSKDELIALDKFYSSPTGQGILSKMPQVGARMPSIMQIFAPRLLASFQTYLAQTGAH